MKVITFIKQHRQQITLTGILVLFVALGGAYAATVPIFEKPDELHHYFVVQHLLDEHTLPVQDGSGETLWAQEASQPPLYYALAALAVSRIDTSAARDLVWLNPQRNMGDPRDPGNKNLIVHTDRERWPYHGTTLAVHVARWLSLLFGAGTVLGTYAIARQIFPARPLLALGAAAVNAFIPQYLFISSSASNDSLIAFLAALALLILVKMIDGKAQNRQISRSMTLGFVLGLAALTKLSGLALLGLSGLTLAWIAWQRRSWRYLLLNGLVVAGATAAIAGWWYIRNLRLYGDLTGLNAMLQVVGQRTDFAASVQALWGEFSGVRASFWGLFGWFNLPLPDQIYWVLDGLLVLGGLGLIMWFLRQRGTQKRALILLLLWTATTFALLVRWTAITPGSQGRLLFPALPAIVLALVIGWSAILPRPWDDALPLAVGGGLLVLSAVVPVWIIAPAYARPPVMPASALPADLPRLDVTFGGSIRLHGCQIEPDRLLPGETLALTCYWQALEPVARDLFFYHHLLGRNLEAVGKEHGYPGSGSFPTSLWPAGQVVAAKEWVRVDEGIVTPTLGQLAVGVYDPHTGKPLPPEDPQGQPLGLILAGQVKIAAPEGQTVQVPNLLDYSAGGVAELVGYEIEPDEIAPGGTLQVTLFWKATAAPPENYTVFLHLLDETGALRGQGDGPPLAGNYPTSLWEPGEQIADRHPVTIDADAPPGRYRLAVGLYRPSDGTRLQIRDSDGIIQPGDSAIWPVEIEISVQE